MPVLQAQHRPDCEDRANPGLQLGDEARQRLLPSRLDVDAEHAPPDAQRLADHLYCLGWSSRPWWRLVELDETRGTHRSLVEARGDDDLVQARRVTGVLHLAPGQLVEGLALDRRQRRLELVEVGNGAEPRSSMRKSARSWVKPFFTTTLSTARSSRFSGKV